ncbi:MAG: ABC transporter permease [Bacillota bacterium]
MSPGERLRAALKPARQLVIPVLAVFSAVVVGILVVALAGFNPVRTLAALVDGAFGSWYNLTETLVKSGPFLFTGLGVAIAFRSRSFNIGAEGQFYMGALVVSWLGVAIKGVPSFVLIPVLLVAAFLAGGAYGAVPGYLKARIGASEIVTTVMLNSIAIQFVSWMIKGPLQEPRHFYPETAEILSSAKLPVLVNGTRLHLGLVVGLLVAVAAYVLIYKTVFGYQLRAVGSGPLASEYAGIDVKRNIILAMAISGGLAGLGGAVELMGVTWKLYQNFSPGYGYSAIAVALLAKRNPVAVILTALLFGALATGANSMQRAAEVPAMLASVMQALVIFFVLAYAVYEEGYVRRRSNRKRTADRSILAAAGPVEGAGADND